jgi:ATP-dependent Clp protease ATP-binding subunit ClpC
MFERFTDSARRIVVLAQQEARDLGHGWIGTEHLLLALFASRPEFEPLAEALPAQPIEEVRAEVGRLVPPGPERPETSGHIPFTPRAKKVLELSLRESLKLGSPHINAGHVLLGLLSTEGAVGVRVLTALGVDLDQLRQHTAAVATADEERPREREHSPGRVVAGRAGRPEDIALAARVDELERTVRDLSAEVAELRRRLDER